MADIDVISQTLGRIEEKADNISGKLDDMRDDHKLLVNRVDKLEDNAARVTGGAAIIGLMIGGSLDWIMHKLGISH